ncbi:MAG: AAA family ATPase [Candidatus Marinimicrobia bacterium]|nr:AAA family ATPase [Candidatus Neomarinimicrobiota bacterium]
MYITYWNLKEAPFQNVTDTRFAYLSPQHEEALARLTYLAMSRKLGGVLTGPYGVGKSMVLRLLAAQVRNGGQSRFVALDYVPGPVPLLAHQVLRQVGCPDAPVEPPDTLEAIRLLNNAMPNIGHVVLAIDESQMISAQEAYHFLHLLTNLTLNDKSGRPLSPAFTLLLAGYVDVAQLKSADESLAQRLQLTWRLHPLTEDQTIEYIQNRIRVAAGDLWIFDLEAMKALHDVAQGIPRIINNLADTALMLGCAAHLRQITPDVIAQAAQDVAGLEF